MTLESGAYRYWGEVFSLFDKKEVSKSANDFVRIKVKDFSGVFNLLNKF